MSEEQNSEQAVVDSNESLESADEKIILDSMDVICKCDKRLRAYEVERLKREAYKKTLLYRLNVWLGGDNAWIDALIAMAIEADEDMRRIAQDSLDVAIRNKRSREVADNLGP